LPGAKLHGYLAKDAGDVTTLTSAYPLVAIHAPMGSPPVICDTCQIVGQRMEMRARHSNEEIQEMLMGQIGKHLFVNEYIVSNPIAKADLSNLKDVCR
jgi:hypothetical protein